MVQFHPHIHVISAPIIFPPDLTRGQLQYGPLWTTLKSILLALIMAWIEGHTTSMPQLIFDE